MAVSRGAGVVLVGFLAAWSIAPGSFGALGAEGPLIEEEVPRPLAVEDSDMVASLGSEVLDLLEGDDELWTESGQYGGDGSTEIVYYESGYSPPARRLWMRGEYLLLWTNGTNLPALIMTGPDAGPAPVLGDGNPVLFGDEEVNREGRSNFRVRGGFWLDDGCRWAMEGDYFDSTGHSAGFAAVSSGIPVLVRPFFDTDNVTVPSVYGASSERIAYPGESVGWVDARAADYFQSSGAWLRRSLFCLEAGRPTGCCDDDYTTEARHTRRFRLDVIGGYRFHRYNDSVSVVEHRVTTGLVPVATMFSIVDSFRASNEFQGGELGLVGEFKRGRWSLGLLAKMALGNNHQFVEINGSTAVTQPGQATQNYPGGLLALPTNIGSYVRNDFVVIPQFEIEVGYQLTRGLRAYAGYNFLYWADVAHAGDQINLWIDSRNIPSRNIPPGPVGGPDPTFAFNQGDFWAQGFTAGFELRY